MLLFVEVSFVAQSFWSKRRSNAQAAGGYLQATDTVSRPTALVITVLGILLVGGLLFGVFSGVRWAYTALTDDSNTTTISNNNDGSTTTDKPTQPAPSTSSPTQTQINTGSITATSSTTTSTPQPSASTPAKQTPASVPNTGPTENYLVLFSVCAVGLYTLLRRRALRS